ncbi:MAG TPA: 16S rRNA (adenine(1518)-N(6)/adenine(1519)-N(6))-dimethyltransferase RsmA [Bryobacterales bacterium]|nr:16S rRNA (adenine(1518)-N(6)/adenine(1519)-N(6))-dimethyltransferase RsmA [Bryobacterales bacterium]
MPASRRAPLGQNFLASPSYLARIAGEIRSAVTGGQRPDSAQAAPPKSGAASLVVGPAPAPSADLIVEIGAGSGALTKYLLELATPLVAVEIDAKLAESLRAALPSPLLDVVNADILKVDLRRLLEERGARRAVVAGNLPYYITSPVLHHIFKAAGSVSDAVLLVQKEVAARIAARAGSREYGYLSVLCRVYSRPELCFTVPPGAFRPAPKVTSALVRLHFEPHWAAWGVDDPARFLDFVKLCFHQKRKTLLNNLAAKFGDRLRSGALARLPELRLRAEQLEPERLAALWLLLERAEAPV